jgi:hypothetical protein
MKGLSIILMAMLVASLAGPAAAQTAGEYGNQANYTGKFYGVVESMPQTGYAGLWIIDGKNVQVVETTFIKEKRGRAAVGAYVEVKGQQTGDTFTAYKIEVEGTGDRAQSPYPGKFYGTVDSIPDSGREGIWIINGRDVLVTAGTRIEEEYGKAAPGSYVEVKGDYSGKTFTAYKIEVKGEKRYRMNTPSRQKAYDRAPDSAFRSEKTYNSKFAGTIESMPQSGYEGLWIINGRSVEVTGMTLIDETAGRAAVGSRARVKGVRTDETITAHEIEIDAKK